MQYFNRIKHYYYVLEYKIVAYASFVFSKLKGSNYKSRTKTRDDISFIRERLSKNRKKRLAIFVAFHHRNLIPESNFNYLNILQSCSFEIIYIHNGILSQKVINQLTNKGCYVICRENIGQDFGAWKDGFALIKYYKLDKDLNWLLFCNDSNFCLGGENANKFISKLSNKLEKINEIDFISLNCNYERRLHYQSYFLCFSKIVFQNQEFQKFWKKYIPLSHRFHAIENGEKKLSSKVLNYFRPSVIFTSHNLAEKISLDLNNDAVTVLGNLPKELFYLEDLLNIKKKKKKDIINARISIKRIISSLENYNQSHVFALLNIIFLDSPFLKKDVVRQGLFSYCQIYDLLKFDNLHINKKLQEEIINFLQRGGTSYSYIEDRRMQYRRGISPDGINFNYKDVKLIREKN
mgnify:CR=1 FL=1